MGVRVPPGAPSFGRSEALLGQEAFRRLRDARILIAGVGGVGSWCAEALVRTGARHLILIDDDVVEASNVNRQCPATARTIGRVKVEAMKERLLEINPEADILALDERITPTSVHLRLSPAPSLVVDAIDSVDCKAALVLAAIERNIPLVSSMGAAMRLDPTKIVVKKFEKVEGDGLARALRQRFKKLGKFPASSFPCVFSTEAPPASSRASSPKPSLMPVTCAFGMALAAEALGLIAATRRSARTGMGPVSTPVRRERPIKKKAHTESRQESGK